MASEYVTVGGDSLPSIAEQYGHPGEWLALAEANEGHAWGDYNNLQPGLTLVIPGTWAHDPEIEPPSSTTTRSGSSSSTEHHTTRSGSSRDD